MLAWLVALAWCAFASLPVALGLYQRFWERPRALWEGFWIELDRSTLIGALVASLLVDEPVWRIF